MRQCQWTHTIIGPESFRDVRQEFLAQGADASYMADKYLEGFSRRYFWRFRQASSTSQQLIVHKRQLTNKKPGQRLPQWTFSARAYQAKMFVRAITNCCLSMQ